MPQIELQTAREYRDQNFLRIRGGKNELDVGRRLFQRLEHGIECMRSELMHFIDHVDLVTAYTGHEGGLLQELHHFIHAPVGRSIHFDVVNKAAGINLLAGRTDTTGC